MVRTLGRELHLRHHAGAARAGSGRRGLSRAVRAAGGGVAAHDAESRWRLGRNLRLVRRSQHQRSGAEHGFADGLGGDGIARRERHAQRFAAARHRLPVEDAAARWSWDESLYTGTGFPRVFYLMYYMYRQYFPLLALTAYAKAMAAAEEERCASRAGGRR